MAYFIYNFLLILLFPFISAVLVIRHLGRFDASFIKTLPQRLFYVPFEPSEKRGNLVVWIHCSSLGEAKICRALYKKLADAAPECSFYISAVTKTAFEWLKSVSGGETGLRIFYAPFDLFFAVKKFVEAVKPSLLVIVETEIWPNLVRYARFSGSSVCLVNARVSNKNFAVIEKFKWFYKDVFKYFDFFLARSQTDSQRLIALGADSSRIAVTGNMKYDIEQPPAPEAKQAPIRRQFGIGEDAKVIAAGSVRQKEFNLILDAYEDVKIQDGGTVLIFAPRHLDALPLLEKSLKQRSVDYILWSSLEALVASGKKPANVIVLDAYGMLIKAYSAADVCVVGGGFENYGGQNIIEPAAMGKPVICGKHMGNFLDIYNLLKSKNAVITAEGREGISRAAKELLSNGAFAAEVGQNAAQAVLSQKGALERNAEILLKAFGKARVL